MDILGGVSGKPKRGEVRCVHGPNGTGKSTLLKVLFGFLPARDGEIRVDGQPLRSIRAHEMRRYGVVYLPQRPSIFPYLSVEVNLRLGAWRYRGERGRVDELVGRACEQFPVLRDRRRQDRKSTRLNSSHGYISYAVFCLKKKKKRCHSDR